MTETIEEEEINKCTIAITVAVAVISLRLSYCCLLAVWFGTTIYSIVSSSSSLLSSLLLSLIVIRLCEATSYCVIRNKCILSVAMLLSTLYLRPCLYLLHSKRIAPYEKSLLKPQNTEHAPYKHRTTTVRAPNKHRTVRCFLGRM